MAKDGLFFRSIAWVHPTTRVPVVAIVFQSLWTAVILLTGRYEQILNYVISMDLLFMGLTALCVFVFRRRDRLTDDRGRYRIPGHPFTTVAFIVAAWAVVVTTIYKYPGNTLIGFAILALGFPAYLFWRNQQKARTLSR
jgi:basic amino acid/polyamine antiporter, APA family